MIVESWILAVIAAHNIPLESAWQPYLNGVQNVYEFCSIFKMADGGLMQKNVYSYHSGYIEAIFQMLVA